jgi:hypothetical protein
MAPPRMPPLKAAEPQVLHNAFTATRTTPPKILADLFHDTSSLAQGRRTTHNGRSENLREGGGVCKGVHLAYAFP